MANQMSEYLEHDKKRMVLYDEFNAYYNVLSLVYNYGLIKGNINYLDRLTLQYLLSCEDNYNRYMDYLNTNEEIDNSSLNVKTCIKKLYNIVEQIIATGSLSLCLTKDLKNATILIKIMEDSIDNYSLDGNILINNILDDVRKIIEVGKETRESQFDEIRKGLKPRNN